MSILGKLNYDNETWQKQGGVFGVQLLDIAAEFGVSISTVESDLRRAYRALADLRRELDEA